jgi:acyl-CoA hydrolase
MPKSLKAFGDAAACVEATLARVGNNVVLALPLGIGKPNVLANAFYRRALADSRVNLKIFTALSLRAPIWHGELERRFVEPLSQRLFGSYLELDYVRDLHAGTVPPNVQVIEFFLEPGAYLNVAHSQQHYVSTNYTHVARDLIDHGVNVVAQLVARRSGKTETEYSLGSNPDVTVDLLESLAPARRQGKDVVVIGEVHRQMPFTLGASKIAAEQLDYLIEGEGTDYDLYAPPNLAINTTEYAIAAHAAALVRDGGTLQLGIGELGDAIVYCLQLRHQRNVEFIEILDAMRARESFGGVFSRVGGYEPFVRGLYACSEMFVDGFLDLYRSGILKRRVYSDLRIQELLRSGRVSEKIDGDFLAALAESGLDKTLSRSEFEVLQTCGVFRSDCRYRDGVIENSDGDGAPALLSDAAARRELAQHCLGRFLTNGVLLHAGFFLGPRAFYAALRDMPEQELRQFEMQGVGFVNQLADPHRALKIAQRQDARFINTTMMVTLLGACVSDGLADGRVVSGVGGQYNFVAMAHELAGARSILALRSTREKDGVVTSNIVWNYGHTTIPRHLRDIVVTEYGVADLRGRTDQDVIAALLSVADSRFQVELLSQAKHAGKLAADYTIPDRHRNNTPQAVELRFRLPRARGLFSEFPFGTDLTQEEILLGKALKRLQAKTRTPWSKTRAALRALVSQDTPANIRPHLARMALEQPQTRTEWLWQRLIVRELRDLLGS